MNVNKHKFLHVFGILLLPLQSIFRISDKNSNKSKMIRTIAKSILLALMSLSTTSMQAQDLLARQAPVDKKMKKVDSVALNRLIYQEMLENPAADLYDDFGSESTHYMATHMPDTATIDLRGF